MHYYYRLGQRSLEGYPEQLYTQAPPSCIPVAMTSRERHALRVTLGQQDSLRKFISLIFVPTNNQIM